MTDTRVRDMDPGDLGAITAIYAQEVETGLASWEWQAPDLSEMTGRAEAIRAQGWPFLVATDRAGDVAGFAYAQPFRLRRAYTWTAEHSVYVAPGARKGGVGRQLMAALFAACEALDARHMLAVIGDPVPTRSIAFHAALGFVMVGQIEGLGFKFGQWLDWTLMYRPLGPGNTEPPREFHAQG